MSQSEGERKRTESPAKPDDERPKAKVKATEKGRELSDKELERVTGA